MPSFETLYQQYRDELLRVVRRQFGDGVSDPEEAVQAAFAQLAEVSKTDPVLNPRAFLHRCARNYIIDQRRRQSVRDRSAPQLSLLNISTPSVEFDGQRVLEAKERLAVVLRTVSGMEAKRRTVLLMHAIDGLGFTEIARRIGLSPTRVMQLFSDALVQCARAARELDEAGQGIADRPS